MEGGIFFGPAEADPRHRRKCPFECRVPSRRAVGNGLFERGGHRNRASFESSGALGDAVAKVANWGGEQLLRRGHEVGDGFIIEEGVFGAQNGVEATNAPGVVNEAGLVAAKLGPLSVGNGRFESASEASVPFWVVLFGPQKGPDGLHDGAVEVGVGQGWEGFADVAPSPPLDRGSHPFGDCFWGVCQEV